MKSSSGTEERARKVARALVRKICGCFDLEKENETTTALLTFAREREIAAAETQAARDVLAERARQVAIEGWTPEHDAQHSGGELAEAAACYLIYSGGHKPRRWPWSREWWKPKGRRRNLVRAGALILAEIERFDRIADAIRAIPSLPREDQSK